MKTIFYSFCLVFSLLCLSCSKDSDTAQINLTLCKQYPSVELSELVKIKKIIPLHDDPSIIIDGIQKIIPYHNEYYVSDSRVIAVYSCGGAPLFQIRRLGRGPQEYLEISDFCIADNKIFILNGRSQINTYSLSGTFISKKKLPYSCDAIASFNKQLILRCCDPSCNYRNLITDSEFSSVHYFIQTTPQQTDCRRFFGSTVFFNCGTSIVFHEPANNNLYLYNNESTPKEYELQFEHKSPFPEIWKRTPMENVMDLITTLQKEGFSYGIPAFAGTPGNFVCTFWNHKEQNLCICKYDGSEAKSYLKLDIDGEEHFVSDMSFYFTSEEDLIILVQSMDDNDSDEKIIHASFPYE